VKCPEVDGLECLVDVVASPASEELEVGVTAGLGSEDALRPATSIPKGGDVPCAAMPEMGHGGGISNWVKLGSKLLQWKQTYHNQKLSICLFHIDFVIKLINICAV
jgi:hypothetical protein